MIERVDRMTAPVVAGRVYLVPGIVYPYCERGRWVRTAEGGKRLRRSQWWPVIGPRHEDAQHLNFPYLHYHVDARFLTKRQIRRAEKFFAYRNDAITAQNTLAFAVAQVVMGEFDENPPLPALVWKRRRARLARIDHPVVEGWIPDNRDRHFKALHEHYRGCKAPTDADGVRICPHKGAPLSNVAPDAQGRTTCPLHGIRFDRDWIAE